MGGIGGLEVDGDSSGREWRAYPEIEGGVYVDVHVRLFKGSNVDDLDLDAQLREIFFVAENDVRIEELHVSTCAYDVHL